MGQRLGAPYSSGGFGSDNRRTDAPSVLLACLLVAGCCALAPWVVARAQDQGDGAPTRPESAGPQYKSATEKEQVELLRKLLGVQAPPPPRFAPAEREEERPEPEPAPVVAPEQQAAPTPAPQPAPVIKAKPTPKPAPKARPAPKAKAKPKSAPKPAPEPTPVSIPAPPSTDPEPLEAAADLHEPSAYERCGISATDLPEPGTLLRARDVERWEQLLGPSIRWALRRGATIEVREPGYVPIEKPREEATERYSAQVHLRGDKRGIVNYVAGLPFPAVTADDPDAAMKIMYNVENRVIVDDLDGQNFRCAGANLDPKQGMVIDRDFLFGHFRRLHYTGRLLIPPTPTWETADGIRYREMLAPIIEPFDLNSAGFTYIRYLDPDRLDDSWLYYPQTRRVRRLSTVQRSEGIYGTDIDLDSYGGFAANPAWFDMQLIGKKTILAPFHSKNVPTKWSDKPADFLFEDTWEARETWIVAARSLLPGYNFSQRVIYIDAASWLIPYTEVYAHDGQLWRSYIQQWRANERSARIGGKAYPYDFDTAFLLSVMVFDMLQEHTTRCQFPSPKLPNQEPWLYWQGTAGTVTPEVFDVANFIRAGH